ncbi:unnamed protein product [Lota lota]
MLCRGSSSVVVIGAISVPARGLRCVTELPALAAVRMKRLSLTDLTAHNSSGVRALAPPGPPGAPKGTGGENMPPNDG